jgi:hypothetical protein
MKLKLVDCLKEFMDQDEGETREIARRTRQLDMQKQKGLQNIANASQKITRFMKDPTTGISYPVQLGPGSKLPFNVPSSEIVRQLTGMRVPPVEKNIVAPKTEPGKDPLSTSAKTVSGIRRPKMSISSMLGTDEGEEEEGAKDIDISLDDTVAARKTRQI